MSKLRPNLIHAQELSACVAHLEQGGAPASALLESQDIPPAAINDPGAMITMIQAYRFLEQSARYTGSEELGSTVGRSVRLSDLGPLGAAIANAFCLLDAARILSSAMHATEPGSRSWIEREHSRAWICYRPATRTLAGSVQAEQFDLQCLLTVARLAVGPDWTPTRIRVSAAPAALLRRIPEFTASEVERHAHTTAIAFPRALLSHPLPSVARRTTGRKTGEQTRTGDDLSASAAIASLLRSLSAHEPIPILETMADRFGVSGRTLQRALEAEGESYRAMADRFMFRRAVRLMQDPTLPVKTIAHELGYGSSASFVRAFRRHCGSTPHQFRTNNL